MWAKHIDTDMGRQRGEANFADVFMKRIWEGGLVDKLRWAAEKGRFE